MTKVLITGATGNVGIAIIKSLELIDHTLELYAAVRNIDKDKVRLANYNIKLLVFDFANRSTYAPALHGCDILFLLRPPQLSDVEKYFCPLIETCKSKGVKHIVFLSVQGVEKSTIIPHHKIEKLIAGSKIRYTFLRPAYFMQNFTTTLRNDLVNNKRICLPAGNARFTLVDIRDIGAVAATILVNIPPHINKCYELTCKEKLTFKEMALMLSKELETNIQFFSPNLFNFFLAKKREKTPVMLILVMIMLHYLPRFKKAPGLANSIEEILNRQPLSFTQFIRDHKKLLTG